MDAPFHVSMINVRRETWKNTTTLPDGVSSGIKKVKGNEKTLSTIVLLAIILSSMFSTVYAMPSSKTPIILDKSVTFLEVENSNVTDDTGKIMDEDGGYQTYMHDGLRFIRAGYGEIPPEYDRPDNITLEGYFPQDWHREYTLRGDLWVYYHISWDTMQQWKRTNDDGTFIFLIGEAVSQIVALEEPLAEIFAAAFSIDLIYLIAERRIIDDVMTERGDGWIWTRFVHAFDTGGYHERCFDFYFGDSTKLSLYANWYGTYDYISFQYSYWGREGVLYTLSGHEITKATCKCRSFSVAYPR